MKILNTLFFFLLTSIVPFVGLYLLFEGMTLRVFVVLYLFLWALLYSYLDKVLLVLLNAREVIDTDEHNLFQNVKNTSYKTYQKIPRVYVYSGQKLNCFVFESRGEWAIVIERSLIKKLDEVQLESLVAFLYEFKKSKYAWIQTKAIGFCALIYSSAYWGLQNIFFLKPNSKALKVLTIFLLLMLRPILGPVETLAKKELSFDVSENLKSLYFQLERSDLSFNEFMLGHLMSNINIRSLMVSYLESFPVLENLGFIENEIK